MRAGNLIDARLLFRRRRVAIRAASSYVRARLFGNSVLRSLDIAVTAECELSCPHCYSRRYESGGRPELTAGEIRRVIWEAVEIGAVMIQFNGGDPLRRPDLDDLVAAVPRRLACVALTSSGLGLDAGRIRRLRDAGLDFLMVSLDSADANVHDSFRGREGLHREAVAALSTARAVGLRTIINASLPERAFVSGDAGRLADLALRLGAALNVIALGPEDAGGPAAAIRRKLLERPHVRWCGDSNFGGGGCGAGREKLSISPYGDVFPCALIQVPAGNIRDDTLASIRTRMLAAPAGVPDVCVTQKGGD